MAVAAFAACLWVAVSPATAQPKPAGPPPALVVTGPVIEQTDMVGGHVFVGTVKPLRHSAVGSAVGGRVVEFYAEHGTAVTAGQPLAKLLTGQIDIQIAAAKAELQLREEELRMLKNGSRQEDIDAARARMEAAKALNEYADSKIRRLRGLFERGVVTEDELLSASSAALAAVNALSAAQAEYDKTVAGPRPEEIGQAEARVASAREEVNRLNDLLEKHTIKSPFDGYVVAEHTEIGQWINPGELVAEVDEVHQVEIEVPVLEKYIAQLALGAEASIELDAVGTELFTGQVTAIVPRADERSRSFPVRVRLANSAGADGTPRIKPGMFARVWLPVEPMSKVLLVPKDAVVLGGAQRMVYVVAPDPAMPQSTAVTPVPVELGVSADSWIEIKGNLAPGAKVVVEGNERLFPGQQVKVVRELAAPARLSSQRPGASAVPPRNAAVAGAPRQGEN